MAAKKSKDRAAALLITRTQDYGGSPRFEAWVVRAVLPGSEDYECHPGAALISPEDVDTAIGELPHAREFRLSAYESGRDEDPKFWGVNLGWERIHFVTGRDCKRMAAAMAKVEKGLASLRERFGYTDSFPQSLLRLADVLGISRVFVTREVRLAAGMRVDSEYDLDARYHACDPAEAARILDRVLLEKKVEAGNSRVLRAAEDAS